MNFSKAYTFYPENKALERAIENSIGMLSDELAEAATPDVKVAVADNFLYTRGNYEQHRFNTNILENLREALEASMTVGYRQNAPLGWAEKQNYLGNVLAALGQQREDTGLYTKAIGCFHKALEEFTQEKSPLEWAATQYNLGTAMQTLGRQQDDSKLLKASVDAYTNALLVWSRKETPEDWASTMLQLGATLHAYGKLLKGNRTLQKSVVAYKNALTALDADNYPFELAAAHNNRGAVLQNEGESEEDPERLKEAVKAYDTALTVCMEQQLPIHLAVLCRVNRATAQGVLAQATNDAALAEEMSDEFELIVECFPNALQPLCLMHCEEQIEKAKSLTLTMGVGG